MWDDAPTGEHTCSACSSAGGEYETARRIDDQRRSRSQRMLVTCHRMHCTAGCRIRALDIRTLNMPLPTIDGVPASRLQLPAGPWLTILECVCAHFPAIPAERWRDRMARGRVLDTQGRAIDPTTPYRLGAEIRYYREVIDEPRIAAQESIVHVDDDLVVVDKPHFLAVTPGGEFVADTLMARMVRRLGNEHLVPLHRLDRHTAGLVLFSANPRTRDRYHALFRDRAISKHYQALAAPLPQLEWPLVHRSRLERGTPFFRMQEVAGETNSETRIDVIERSHQLWRYALQPITGRTHQLRVHMAALGAGIRNDTLYPELQPFAEDQLDRPLQLLAKSLTFIDPLDASVRRFDSGLRLEVASTEPLSASR